MRNRVNHIGAVVTAALVILAVPAAARDVIFVPTPMPVVERMLEIAEVGPEDTVIDLGSGDGRIVIAAVKDFGARRAIGVDIDPRRIAESRENAREAGVEDRVEFRQEDIFVTDIAEADVVTMYLLPTINEKLMPRLLTELRPGTRIVSHDFRMGDWEPEHKEFLDGSVIYAWTVPARVEGEWQVQVNDPEGPRQYLLHVEQDKQELEAAALGAGQGSAVGRVEGDQVTFVLDDQDGQLEFTGEARGADVMRGTVRDGEGEEIPWQARRLD